MATFNSPYVAFAETASELSLLRSIESRLSGRLHIVAVSPEVDYLLSATGVDYLTVEDMCDWTCLAQFGPQNIEIAERLLEALTCEIYSSVAPYPDVDLFTADCWFHPVKGMLDSLVTRSNSVRGAFDQLQPDGLIAFLNDEYAVSGTGLLDKPAQSLTNRIAILEAQRRKLPILLPSGGGDRLNPPSSVLLSQETGPLVIENGEEKAEIVRRIVAFVSQEQLKSRKIPILFASGGIDNYNNDILQNWVDHARGVSFAPEQLTAIPRKVSDTGVLQFYIEAAHVAWRRIRLLLAEQHMLQFGQLDMSPFMLPLLKKLVCEELPHLLLCAPFIRRNVKELNQAVLLVGGMMGIHTLLARACGEAGVPVVSTHRGGFMGYNILPFHERYDLADADYLLCGGVSAAETYRTPPPEAKWRAGRKRAQPMPLGMPWIDQLIQSQCVQPGFHDDSRPERRTLMYVISALLGDNCYIGNVFQPEIWLRRLQFAVVELAAQYSNCHLLIKPPLQGRYPTIINPLFRWIEKKRFQNVSVFTEDRPLEECIGAADAFIIDSPSTGLWSLVASEKPFLAYFDRNYFKMVPTAVDALRRRAIYSNSREEFLEQLKGFFERPSWELSRPVDDEFLKKFGTHLNDGRSAERVAEFLLRIASKTQNEKEPVMIEPGTTFSTPAHEAQLADEERLREAIKGGVGEQRTFYPSHLAIETVRACDADCIMCPSSTMERAKGILKPEVHQTILRKVSEWGAPVKMITHAGLGEPLLDKRLEERINEEKRMFPKAIVIVYSNGNNLSEERAYKLIDCGVDVMSFSINGFRKETYEAVMKLSREKVYTNVERFLEIIKKTGAKIQVHVSLIKTDLCSEDEIREFIAYWSPKGVRVITPPWISWGKHFENPHRKPQLPCSYIWKTMMFDQDGTVKMCCEDFESKYQMGNILENSPDEIFNSPKMKRQRHDQLNGKFNFPDICLHCVETHESARAYWEGNPELFPAPDTNSQLKVAPKTLKADQQKRLRQQSVSPAGESPKVSAPSRQPASAPTQPSGVQSVPGQVLSESLALSNRSRPSTAPPRSLAQPLAEVLQGLVPALDSLDSDAYKTILAHLLAHALKKNSFEFPRGIWPPPSLARAYILMFLEKHLAAVGGRCVEFYPAVYHDFLLKSARITSYDVWNYGPGNGVTINADLQDAVGVPDRSFDTIILVHVLSAIRNPRTAMAEVRRILKPGGVVLCTVPAILQRYAPDPKDYWRFTKDSVADLFAEFSRVEIQSYGNAATVAGSPLYLMTHHFPEDILSVHSDECPSIIAAAAWK